AFLMLEVIGEETKDENNKPIDFDIDRFVKYLLSNIYFVIIETRAGLSKTLQIFNAINTTGLDLNGGDIFKIKMYEYLRDKKHSDETAFDEISNLYQKIDEQNAALGHKITNILDILGIYQYILIAKYNLPITLYTYATETFFERLFDTIFKINQWEHFKNNVKKLELSLEEIEKIITVRYEWEKNWYQTAEDACAYSFITWSRYGRYWRLLIIFLYRFREEENFWEKFFLFTRQLCKLYVIYSIRFLRAVNVIHTFTYSLVKILMNKTMNEVIETINQKIGTLDNHKGWGDFEVALTGDITYNRKVKDIICRLSAMLEENYTTSDQGKIETIRKKLFESAIDIEHIQAYHDIQKEKRECIWKEWGENINSIGNLVVLEYNINRSIRNYAYADKLKRYPESCYAAIEKVVSDYPVWHLDNCLKRKKEEVEKILKYIFHE
ncbi:MAG: HNH endonuclease family protein, partial [Candidatus Cloacimonetes bacterium]|nr:HNH endonuclease family protein [Candidatus Cloacimonadota bacterium]